MKLKKLRYWLNNLIALSNDLEIDDETEVLLVNSPFSAIMDDIHIATMIDGSEALVLVVCNSYPSSNIVDSHSILDISSEKFIESLGKPKDEGCLGEFKMIKLDLEEMIREVRSLSLPYPKEAVSVSAYNYTVAALLEALDSLNIILKPQPKGDTSEC